MPGVRISIRKDGGIQVGGETFKMMQPIPICPGCDEWIDTRVQYRAIRLKSGGWIDINYTITDEFKEHLVYVDEPIKMSRSIFNKAGEESWRRKLIKSILR